MLPRDLAMSAPKNFATGFNHNIKHRGQVFHVQTEDSGESIAVVATHLFIGGTIIATRRQSYADLAAAADRKQQVRSRMELQHKQMLRDLVNGEFDGKVQGITAYQPGQLAMGTAGPARAIAPVAAAPARQVAHATPIANGQAPVPEAIVLEEVVLSDLDAEDVDTLDLDILVEEEAAFAPPLPGRATRLDDDLPWARAAARATLFDDGVVGVKAAVARMPRQPPPPPPAAGFGDELISDKSLDEVILAYLAESDE